MRCLLLALLLTGCYPDCPQVIQDIDEVCVPNAEQVLYSYGGEIIDAIKIANMTINTHVNTYCASSCVMIASAGEHRTACEDALYGLHSANIKEGNLILYSYFSRQERIDSNWVNYYISITPNDSIYRFSAHTAKAVGLVDEVIKCD